MPTQPHQPRHPRRWRALPAGSDGRSLSRDLAGGFPEGPGSGATGGAAFCRSGYGLRLTVLKGLSLRASAAQLQISPIAVSHREVRLAIPLPQKKALAALRQQLVGAG